MTRKSECRQARRWMHDGFDGESNPTSSARLARHLVECPPCQRLASQFGQLLDLAACLPDKPLPRPEGTVTSRATPAPGWTDGSQTVRSALRVAGPVALTLLLADFSPRLAFDALQAMAAEISWLIDVAGHFLPGVPDVSLDDLFQAAALTVESPARLMITALVVSTLCLSRGVNDIEEA